MPPSRKLTKILLICELSWLTLDQCMAVLLPSNVINSVIYYLWRFVIESVLGTSTTPSLWATQYLQQRRQCRYNGHQGWSRSSVDAAAFATVAKSLHLAVSIHHHHDIKHRSIPPSLPTWLHHVNRGTAVVTLSTSAADVKPIDGAGLEGRNNLKAIPRRKISFKMSGKWTESIVVISLLKLSCKL